MLVLQWKKFSAVLLSAMMALPAQGWAGESSASKSSSREENATDGVPALVEPIQINGQTAYLAMASVPQTQERELVTELAKRDAKHMILAVTDPDDPALKAALESGYLPWINTFQIGDASRSSVLKSSSGVSSPMGPTLKKKILAKVRQITDYAKKKKRGLFFALVYASAVSGFTLYDSSSIDAGTAVLIPIFLLSAFISTQSMKWGKVLEKGEQFHVRMAKTVLGWFGRELTSMDKHLLQVTGRFNTSWAVSSLSVAYIFWQAGTLENLLQAVWFGFLANYNIWDSTMFRKVREKVISADAAETYFSVQLVAGTVAEVAAWFHMPHFQLIVGTITTAGLLYLGAGPAIDRKVASLKRSFRPITRAKVLRRRARGFVRTCADLLSGSQLAEDL
jgi:hypothetical protein